MQGQGGLLSASREPRQATNRHALIFPGSSFPATTYTRLAATAVRDSTSLTLDTSPVGWQAGDEVVITSTDFFSDQTQVRFAGMWW